MKAIKLTNDELFLITADIEKKFEDDVAIELKNKLYSILVDNNILNDYLEYKEFIRNEKTKEEEK